MTTSGSTPEASSSGPKVIILNLPSPPRLDVDRDYSGGYGTGNVVSRQDFGHSGDVVFPVFMPYLATALKQQGWKFGVVDAQASRLNLDETVEAVAAHSPDFIVSLVSLPTMADDLQVLARVKEKLPKCVVVVAGTIAKTLKDEVLQHPAVDYLISANYPFYGRPVIDLVHAWQAQSPPPGRFLSDSPASSPRSNEIGLDALDLSVYREFAVMKSRFAFCGTNGEPVKYFPILSSAGCPYPCSYCPYPLGFGKTITCKSPRKIVEEMQFLNSEFGVDAFLFRDQVFTANRSRVEALCDLILERGIKVQWLFETRVDRVCKELLGKVRAAGCNRIHFGIETGDAEFLRRVGKPGVEQRQALEAFHLAASLGIRTVAHIIVGLPGETRETLQNTYQFLGELDPDNTSWNLATPYPGTQIFEEARAKNLILTRDWAKYNTNELVMRSEALSGPELLGLMNHYAKKDRRRKVFRRAVRALHCPREMKYLVRRSLNKVVGLAKH